MFVHDQPVMARGKVRYVGEAVAAVAAEDALIAKRALCEDQGGIRAAARGVRSARGDAAGRAGAARLRAGQSSPSTFRSASAMSRRASPNPTWSSRRPTTTQPIEHAYLEPEAGLAYVDHDGVVTIVSPEPEHHPSPPHAGAHHRQADQQGALHHEPGRRRLRRQGRHDLPGHAGADGDEDAAPGAACVHARGIDRRHGQAPSVAHDVCAWADARRPHPRDWQ